MSETTYPQISQEIFNPINENLKKLEQLFPSCIKDGQLDLIALKEELGEFEAVGQERYELNWAGKQNAKKNALEDPIGRTLKYYPDESKNPETTENLYIEGDNLEVLKLLRKNYYRSVKMIYIDPPYNTGNDYIYVDNRTISQEEMEKLQGDRDVNGKKLVKNSKDSARYHTNWLNIMYPVLKIAKDLLTDEGVIFISIDDNEIFNLRKLCNDIFGEENFIAQLPTIMNLKGNNDEFGFAGTHEYTLVYSKFKEKSAYNEFPIDEEDAEAWEEDEIGCYKKGATLKATGEDGHRDARPYMFYPMLYNEEKNEVSTISNEEFQNLYNKEKRTFDDEFLDTLIKKYEACGYNVILPKDDLGNYSRWRWGFTPELRDKLKTEVIVLSGGASLYKKQRPSLGDLPSKKPKTTFYKPEYSSGNGTAQIKNLFNQKVFSNPKPMELIKDFITIGSNENDIIMDFFSGSATTANAVLELNLNTGSNRKYIMVQYQEDLDKSLETATGGTKKVIENAITFLDSIDKPHLLTELGKERIHRAGKKIKVENPDSNVDIGFKVFKVADTNLNWQKRGMVDGQFLPNTEQLNLGKFLPDSEKQLVLGEYDKFSEKDKLDFTALANDMDVVYEIMLREEGVELSSKIEKLSEIGDRTYMFANSYVVCLEENISESILEKLSNLNPIPFKFVFRDSAFGDDVWLKDRTFRELKAFIEKSSKEEKSAYTVAFI